MHEAHAVRKDADDRSPSLHVGNCLGTLFHFPRRPLSPFSFVRCRRGRPALQCAKIQREGLGLAPECDSRGPAFGGGLGKPIESHEPVCAAKASARLCLSRVSSLEKAS